MKTQLEQLILAFRSMCQKVNWNILVISLLLLIQVPSQGQNLLLFDGESIDYANCQLPYGSLDSTNVHTGQYAFKGNPDPWHSPGINMRCQGAWRKNISNYNQLEFYIKATSLGRSATVSMYGWPNTSRGVDILPYIQGGILDTVYRKVSIPIDSMKTASYGLESIEILYFGKQVGSPAYNIYIDDVYAIDTRPNAVDSVFIVSNSVLKLDIMHRYDTTQVQNPSLYSLTSNTDSDFFTPQQPSQVGMHYYVKNFERQVIAIPIFEQEIFLVFAQKMKEGHQYSLVVQNIQDLSQNNFTQPYQYDFTFNSIQYITGTVKTNQIGFQPNGFKYGYIGNYLGGANYLNVNAIDVHSFEIRDATSHSLVFSGVPSYRGLDIRLSGEKVFDCNFSAFQTPGQYYLYVPGMGRSYTFSINDSVYDAVHETVLRAFYYQRHSEDLTAPYVPAQFARGHCPTTARIDVSHTASGLYDAATDHPVGTVLNMPGGWFDAGDYGRYVPTASVALDYIFNAYEMYPEKFGDQLNIPESNNGIPDILDEAKVELDWLLHMQAPDGGVYFKVTTTAYTNSMPPQNTATRYIAEKTTFSTALFAATMAQAYRQYKLFMPVFADTCLARAEKAWNFLLAHPNTVPLNGYQNSGGLGGGTYSDPLGDADDRAWAAAELYKSTGDTSYHSAFEYYWLQHPANWGWNFFQHHQQKASWAYCTTSNYPTNSSYVNSYKNLIRNGLDNYDKVRADQNIYRCSYRSDVIPWIGWGSFAQSSSYSWGFIQGYYLLGKPEYLDYARLNFDVQLGANPQYTSYITGVGQRYPMFPTHHPSEQDGVAEPIPGLPVHGPHSHIPMSNGFYTESQKYANLYPAGQGDYDPYPTLRRYYDIFHLVQMSEFTIEHIAKTAVAFAFFNTEQASYPLPIELLAFKAECLTDGVELQWTNATAQSNGHTVVQKLQANFNQWITIGEGIERGTNSFHFVDKAPGVGTAYYRLQQVDDLGVESYSHSIAMRCGQAEQQRFKVYPNPATHELYIALTEAYIPEDGLQYLEIYDVLGQCVHRQGFDYEINIAHLQAGFYVLKLGGQAQSFVKE